MMESTAAVIGFLAALGLAALLWLTFGRLLLPVGEMGCIEVHLACDENLEQNLKGLEWLHTAGLLNSCVVISEEGLSQEERDRLVRLLSHWNISLRTNDTDREG